MEGTQLANWIQSWKRRNGVPAGPTPLPPPTPVSAPTQANTTTNPVSTTAYFTPNATTTLLDPSGAATTVSAWQGIKDVGDDNFVIVGTTGPNPQEGNGIVYVGSADCINGTFYYLNVPASVALYTSVYGVDVDTRTGIFSFVGSFTPIGGGGGTRGFAYVGTLDDLVTVPGSPTGGTFYYSTTTNAYADTFFHSIMNGYFVGNSASPGDVSYVVAIADMETLIMVDVPDSLETTTYSIWYNGGDSFTLGGGYTHATKGNIAFVADFTSSSATVHNYTDMVAPPEYAYTLSHIQGIYGENATTFRFASAAYDGTIAVPVDGLVVSASRLDNVYATNTINLLSYGASAVTSANSISRTTVVGVVAGSDPTSYQATIEYVAAMKSTFVIANAVGSNALLQFAHTFLASNDDVGISYVATQKGVFTVLTAGTYMVSFTVYVENTTLPAVMLGVEYTVGGIANNFTVAQKGIDDMGTGTAHSLAVPCTFIQQFSQNDTLRVRNISGGRISLTPTFVKNSIGAMLSMVRISA
jgi:hypothetical protein